MAKAAQPPPGSFTLSTNTVFSDTTVLTNVVVSMPVGTFNNATVYAAAALKAGIAQFSWSASAGAAGYAFYYGDVTRSATNRIDALGNQGIVFYGNLVPTSTYFFYVTAYDATHTEGPPTAIVVLKPGS